MLSWDIEEQLQKQGKKIVCGVDEAGRGPLAGPVYAAAVLLPLHTDIQMLDDSKKLSPKKRDSLYDIITSKAEAYAVSFATHEEIDELNILQAAFLAMNRALNRLSQDIDSGTIDTALIDGNQNSGIKYPSICVVKGDGKSPSIAAASILAKVSRDRYMIEMAHEYPGYGFEKHKGYGTPYHIECIRKYGPSKIHRKTFLKRITA